MSFSELIDRLVSNTVDHSLGLFAPELILCVTVVLLLLARLIDLDRKLPSYWVAMSGVLVAFAVALLNFWHSPGTGQTELFTGLLVHDQFTLFFRLFLLLFLVLVISLTVLSGLPDNEDGPDFYTLLIGSTIGMMLMVEANHLLILFLGVEMTSVPSYAMVGFLKGRRQSSEASLKYVVYGAGAAGVMLYGLSLLGGMLGTANLPEMAARFALVIDSDATMGSPELRTLALGILMVVVGLSFKLSLVPFHFWCPDAFEGAAAEVAGFLSIASKAAAFALLVRFCLVFAGTETSALGPLTLALGIGLGVIAIVTTTFGNLAAYSQTNVKRLLAYSTIAHAGYMLMAVSAMLVVLYGNQPDATFEATRAVGGLLFYLVVYLFMNLGAFAVVALIRNQIFSEEIEDYRGLAWEAPALCVCMLICFFSLVGLPPMGGFFGKWYIFASLYKAGSVHWSMWVLLVVGGLNTVFSLFYYLRVLKAMFIETRPSHARSAKVQSFSSPVFYVGMVTAPVILLGTIGWLMDGLSNKVREVAGVLF